MTAAAPPPLDSLDAAITLPNGVDMPMLGFGTWQLKDPDVCVPAVRAALDAGYKHLDTALIYGNETSVGKAVKEHGRRDELFITTKLWNEHHAYDDALKGCDESLKNLGVDHVDLYLMHWPCGMDFLDAWRAMEKCLEQGKTRAIGCSNFLVPHFQKLLDEADVKPVVNQFEFHAWLQQPELLKYHDDHGIVGEAWSPLMRGHYNDIPEIGDIAEAHGKSRVQVLLRWVLQRGLVTIPRSSKPDHIRANAEVFDFALTDDQMNTLNGLDQNKRLGGDPMTLGT